MICYWYVYCAVHTYTMLLVDWKVLLYMHSIGFVCILEGILRQSQSE